MGEINYAKILVPTDGSDYAARAGEHAIYLAQKTGARIYVLNVVDTSRAFHAGIHYAEDVCEREKAGNEATGRIREMCEKAGVPCEEIIARGRPAEVIVNAAGELGVDCIAIGSLGVSALERILIGSVSGHVLHHAPCPVLLVRES